jgi:hypothetical protein
MRHVVGMVFAISVAGVAAVAATTAFLNSPLHIGPPPSTTPTATPSGQTPAEPGKAPAPDSGTAPAPAEFPDAPARGGGAAGEPDAPKPGAAKPAEGEKPADGTAEDDKEDKDPYEGIAPEDLPPDLQYDADSSVSFPTNT